VKNASGDTVEPHAFAEPVDSADLSGVSGTADVFNHPASAITASTGHRDPLGRGASARARAVLATS